MHSLAFLQDLALVMIVAGLVTVLCHRFKQPVVLGYIIAGVIIGPHTPPYNLIHDTGTVQILSELGVIFLMFSLGLEFSLRKLRAVGSTAFIAATLEIVLLMFVGYQIGKFFGWKPMDSLFLGAILAISSTTIIMKAFSELKLGKTKFAGLVFGILIVEDMLGIVLIALLSGIAKTGALQGADAAATIGQLGVFLVVSLVIGLIAVPRLITFVSRFASAEMLLITVLGLCFGFTLITVKLEYSVALGAFLIGAILAEAKELGKIETLMHPIRDMFSAVFFVSVGLLINPALILEHWAPIAVISVAVIVGKVISCSLGAYITGNDIPTSTRVGMSLSQIGEFSFIIAALGLTLGVTSGFLYPIAVSVSAITTLTTPYLIRGSDPFSAWLVRIAPKTTLSYANLYTSWYGQFKKERREGPVRKILRRIMGQLGIFLSLIAGSLLAAVGLSRLAQGYLPWAREWPNAVNSVLWLAAIVAVLPVYIAAFRKLKALGMMIAELGITEKGNWERRTELRAIVANGFLVFALVLLAAFTFGLSYAVLPSFYVLPLLGGIIALLVYFLRDSFNKVYFQGKAALAETFSKPAPLSAHDAPALEPDAEAVDMLRREEARLETLVMSADMPGTSSTIREIALRTQTGALIVGIGREHQNTLINPAADEVLHAGDKIMLFGNNQQLEDAFQLLSGGSEHVTETGGDKV
jgi:CPA2 family monovalent cation:H+ antiporter-2